MSLPAYCKKNADGSVKCWFAEQITEEQLRTALNCHEKGLLIIGGSPHLTFGLGENEPSVKYNDTFLGCINQHIYQIPNPHSAQIYNVGLAAWFDYEYKRHWSRGEFEFELRKMNFVKSDGI